MKLLTDTAKLRMFETCKSRAKILGARLNVETDTFKVSYAGVVIFETDIIEELNAFLVGFQLGKDHSKI